MRNANIVDPSNSALLAGLHDVVAENGLIISMSPSIEEHEAKLDSADADLKDPKPIIVDLSGKYLCP